MFVESSGARRQTGRAGFCSAADWLACNGWHTSVTPLFKTLDFVATVHLREKLLVTRLIENFPKFMDCVSWLRSTRHPTKHWFLLDTHMTPIHIFTTCPFQIHFNNIFLSICLFLCRWVVFSLHRFRLRFYIIFLPFHGTYSSWTTLSDLMTQITFVDNDQLDTNLLYFTICLL